MTQQTESFDGSMQLESIEQTDNDLTQGENFVSSPLKRRRNESPIWTYCVRLDNGQKKCNVDYCLKFFEKTTSNSAIMDNQLVNFFLIFIFQIDLNRLEPTFKPAVNIKPVFLTGFNLKPTLKPT